ncbi:MAG: potassium channel family protein [Halothiobacillaceae bacterium]
MKAKDILHKLPIILGVGGISPNEPQHVRRVAFIFDWFVILAALMLPFIWYAKVKGMVDDRYLIFLDRFVWSMYALEMLIVSLLVRKRLRFWRGNWLSVLIVLIGFPLVIFSAQISILPLLVLRAILLVSILVRGARQSLRMLAKHALAATLSMALFLTLSIGTLVATIDPAFDNLWDGLWWALVTVSTVGYGDFVPESATGRVLGAILILFGVLTFSMVMANVSAFLVSLKLEETTEAEDKKDELIDAQLLQRLGHIEARFERLEKLLEQSIAQGATSSDAPRSNAPSHLGVTEAQSRS